MSITYDYRAYLDFVRIQNGLTLPTDNQSPSPLEAPTPSQQPEKSETTESIIDWANRDFKINPSWYQTKKGIQIAGKSLIGIGVSFGALSILAASRFTATPQVVIRVVHSLRIATFISLLLGVCCFAKRVFKNDPAYLRTEGSNAEAAVKKAQMTYPEIVQKYSHFFTNEDINHFLEKEIGSRVSYKNFILRHGIEVLSILNDANRAKLKDSFLIYILSQPTGADGVWSQFSKECGIFKIPFDYIQDFLISRDAKYIERATMSYATFRTNHGPEALKKFPSDYLAQHFLPAFLNYISSLNTGLIETEKAYSVDCNLLTISPNLLAERVLPREIDSLLVKKIKYIDFQTRNGSSAIGLFKYLSRNDPSDNRLNELREYSKTLPFSEMETFFSANATALNLSESMKWQAIRSDADKLSYPFFRAKHGIGSLATIFKSGEVPSLKEKFTTMAQRLTFHDLARYIYDFGAFELPYYQYRNDRLEQELKTVHSLEDFISRYGFGALDEVLEKNRSKIYPKIPALIIDYLINHLHAIFIAKNDPYIDEIKKRRLIPSNIIPFLLNALRQLASAQEYYDSITKPTQDLGTLQRNMEGITKRAIDEMRTASGVESLEALINEKKAEIGRVSKEISELTADLKRFEGIQTNLQIQEKTRALALEELGDEPEEQSLKKAIEDLKAELETLKKTEVVGLAAAQQATDAQNFLEKKVKANEKALAHIEEQKAAIKDFDNFINMLRGTLSNGSKENSNNQSRLERAKRVLATLQQELGRLKTELTE